MIHVVDLHKAFGDTSVLRGASFSVASGMVTALVGANGSGKTTTLNVLAGLTAPDAGTVMVDGVDVTTDRSAAQEHLAYLPQDVHFHEALTPRQVVCFYAGLRDAPAGRIGARLDDVGLAGAADDPCGTLSGGMRQRLGIAVLELADAPVLLLDEPALSLDPEWRTFLMERLRARVDEGAAVLLATHLLEVWGALADQVLRCDDGRIREVESHTSSVASIDESARTL